MNDKYYVSIILMSLFLIGVSTGFQARVCHQPSVPFFNALTGVDDFSLYLKAENVQSIRELYDRYATSAIENATSHVPTLNQQQFNMPTSYGGGTSFEIPPVVLSSSVPFLAPLVLHIKKRKKDLLFFALMALLMFFAGWGLGNSYGSVTKGPGNVPRQIGEPYHFMIYTDGSTIHARNGLTGKIEYGGSDAATVIQWAANSLTKTRSSVETIYVDGFYEISKSITFGSYTKIFLNGTLTLGKLVSQPIFVINSGPATRVEFSGGTYDMNSNANPAPNNAIDFQSANTSYVIVHDVTFANVSRSSFGVHFTAPNNNNIIITHNWCYSCGGSAGFSSGGLVYVDFGSQIVITDNFSTNGGIDIRLSKATYSVIAKNKIQGNYPKTGGGGVTLVGTGGHDVVVSQNEISGKAQECVEVVQLDRVYLVRNKLYQCANEGLHLWGIAHSLIASNLLWNNGAHSPDNSQITAQLTLGLYGDSAVHNWVVNNVIYSDGATTLPQYAIWENSTSDFNLFYGNVIRGYSIAAYHLRGVHDVVVPDIFGQLNQSAQITTTVGTHLIGYVDSSSAVCVCSEISPSSAQRRTVQER